MSQSFLIILVCFIVVDLVASLICYSINPDLGETVTNIFLIVLLIVVMVGLVGSIADPSQENSVEVRQSATDGAAIYTIQVIENDGSISFKYSGDVDVEIHSGRITLYDNDETWTVPKSQSSRITINKSK